MEYLQEAFDKHATEFERKQMQTAILTNDQLRIKQLLHPYEPIASILENNHFLRTIEILAALIAISIVIILTLRNSI